jgi:hypothetical protein
MAGCDCYRWSWPEDDHPGQSVVEAIAGNLAIEHTSVDTLPDQCRIGEQFMDTLSVVELLPVLHARLSILVPYELVTVGSDWEAFRLALAHWILITSTEVQDGRHEIEMPGTSLKCLALKESGRPRGVFLARPVQDDPTLPQRVGQQIARKMKKLRRYKADGYMTPCSSDWRGHVIGHGRLYRQCSALRYCAGPQRKTIGSIRAVSR